MSSELNFPPVGSWIRRKIQVDYLLSDQECDCFVVDVTTPTMLLLIPKGVSKYFVSKYQISILGYSLASKIEMIIYSQFDFYVASYGYAKWRIIPPPYKV